MAEIVSEKRFQKIKKIGQGTYGSVTKVYDKQIGIFVAIKKIKFQQDEQTIPIYALREIAVLKQLDHPNIIKVYNIKYEVNKRKLSIVFQYIEQTLEDFIRRAGSLSTFTIKMILYQLLQALKYMESHNYMHRDLKPQNIMITSEIKLKLIDFGQTKKLSYQSILKQKQTLQVSTLWYKAPELLFGNQYYNNKIEIWAVGVIFAEMALGKPLFSSTTQIQQIFQILKLLGTPNKNQNKYMKEWLFVSPTLPRFETKEFYIPILGEEGNSLLKRMICMNPMGRVSISQALNDPYFAGIA